MKIETKLEGGSVAVERLAFDSEVFGIAIARVTKCEAPDLVVCAAIHAAAAASAEKQGVDLLWRTVPADANVEIAALEANRYALCDVGVTLAHDLRGVASSEPSAHGARVASDEDIEQVVAECATIFRLSRYYRDPALTPEGADELHRQWIWNSQRGRADAVLVLDDRSAFATCAVNAAHVGNIALFGVAPRAQGRGAGQRLLGAALGWFAERAASVEVKTQATNYAACRMYERGGFRLSRSDLTYGRRLGR